MPLMPLTRREALAGMGLACASPWVVPAEPAARVRALPAAEGVWFAQGEAALGSAANRNFVSNAGFVVTGGGAVVIDALGSPVLAAELVNEIRRITPQPIRHVVVTHFYADHIYGLQVFKAAGATVLAHPAGREYLNSDAAQRRLAASRQELTPWIDAGTRLVAGHGPLSNEPLADLELTRDYLLHLRKTMGDAAASMEPFESAYARADWSRFEQMPLFRTSNRMNAFNTYLLMEQQGTAGQTILNVASLLNYRDLWNQILSSVYQALPTPQPCAALATEMPNIIT